MSENDSLNFNVNLNNYTGSLELLLDLAKSQKVDLEKISITTLADQFYDSSFSSIKKIPFKFRFAILVARRIYRQIGRKILKKKTMENYSTIR